MPAQLVGEFLGTTVLIILGDGVVANVVLSRTKGNNGGWIVITAGWALGVVMGIFTAIAIGAPEADLNPAVTLSKLLKGNLPPGPGPPDHAGPGAGRLRGGVHRVVALPSALRSHR